MSPVPRLENMCLLDVYVVWILYNTEGLVSRIMLGEDYDADVPHHLRVYRYYYYLITRQYPRLRYDLEDPFGLSPTLTDFE